MRARRRGSQVQRPVSCTCERATWRRPAQHRRSLTVQAVEGPAAAVDAPAASVEVVAATDGTAASAQAAAAAVEAASVALGRHDLGPVRLLQEVEMWADYRP